MTRRPVLAPGLTVRRRTSTELQVGLTERYRLRVADTPAVRRTLAVLSRGEAPRTDRDTRQVIAALAPVLRDGDALVQPGIPASEVAAVSLLHPRSAPARLRARRATGIGVLGDLGPGAAPFLTRSGLTPVPPEEATVLLVLSDGPLDRGTTDGLVRAGVPHLLVEAVESDVVVGPFVVPGRTACLRCLDAHRAAADPLHPVLVNLPPETARQDGVTAPLHAAMASLALSWAAADLVRYVEGDRPWTWSATVTCAPDHGTIAPVGWLRHPACGCSWTVARPHGVDRSDRMGP